MSQLISNYTNFCSPSSTNTLKSGSGKIHAIFATSLSTTPVTVTIYDNTAGSGNVLYSFQVAAPYPFCLVLPNYQALRFYTGCTVVTPANVYCFLVTEESEETVIPPTSEYTPYHCRVYNSTVITVPTASYTNLTYDSEQSDEGAMHSTVSNTQRITMPAAGFFVFGGCASFAAHATGVRYVRVLHGGSTNIAANYSNNLGASYATILSVSGGYDFAQDEYITFNVFQNSGGALDVNPISFWAAKVH